MFRSVRGGSFFCLPVFAGSAPGIKNFDKVDAHVYRGAQPTDEGFQYLAKLGVKTIIDLRETDERSMAEEHVVTDATAAKHIENIFGKPGFSSRAQLARGR